MRGLFAAILFVAGTGLASAETLTVGAYPANPPWEVKAADGSFEGFEVDLAEAIAGKLGMDIAFQDLGFQALFAATSSGRVDVAISSITITEDRLKNQDFTQGYYDADIGLGVRADGDVATVEDLNGKPVGVLSSSTGEAWAKENQAVYGFSAIRGYNAYQDMLLDLQAGRIAGAVSDITGLQYAFEKMPALKVAARIKTGDRYGMMLAKNSPLTERVNDAISALKEDGTLAAIYETHLGVAPDPGTSTVTVLDLPTAD
ncbi:ABC transporter substrate-binding protein [Acuticoccus sp. M5D2P5]|uniref:ABC transporter substrate-binding protein n=1 Tax=Acuticoccus kalidii TaxID=2910977 RepID=UPI001F3D83F8|nr:ABC transporter substrate-binding protein [Acuticoccus kalidii]MCF3932854.1 ABC transporter substrate-binding protein [Acuticoccus kalidii]